jgi:hypothetical protein
MNPVIGLDIAKGESQVQAFIDRVVFPFFSDFYIIKIA